MRVDGQLNPAALWFKNVEKDPSTALDKLIDQGAIGKSAPAKTAASNTSFPTQMTTKLDSASILSLQQAEITAGEDAKPDGVSAADEFLAYMEKTPEERMRANILKSLGITEEELENLPPKQRQAIEDKIKEMLKEQVKLASGFGFEVPESVNQRPASAQLVEMGLIKPGASAASLGNGLPADVLAAAGYKPKE